MERRGIQRILNKNLCETWLLSRPQRQKAICQLNWQTYKKVSWNRDMGIKNLDWFKLGRSPVQDYLLGHVQTASDVAAIFTLLSESDPQRCDFTTDVKLVQTTSISFTFKLMWSSFESSVSRLQLSSFQVKSSQFSSLKAARRIRSRSRSMLAVVSTFTRLCTMIAYARMWHSYDAISTVLHSGVLWNRRTLSLLTTYLYLTSLPSQDFAHFLKSIIKVSDNNCDAVEEVRGVCANMWSDFNQI